VAIHATLFFLRDLHFLRVLFDAFGAFVRLREHLLKKPLIGCLGILVLAAIAVAAGSYFLYRAATPYIEDARSYVRGLSELGEIEKDITNTSPHTPPASGELTEAQIQRFARVQEHTRNALGQRMREFEEKYKHLSDSTTNREPSFSEMTSGLRDLASVFVEARRYQVDALNKERFSQQEYSWVRLRVFEAAGMEVANMVDLTQLERAIREGTGIQDFKSPDLPKPDVPAKNRELVKPFMKQFDEWLPLAFFGL
jgi:hypothetical protein